MQLTPHLIRCLSPDQGSPQKVVMEYLPPSRSLTVAEGGSASFTCHARGTPQPSVTWYRVVSTK